MPRALPGKYTQEHDSQSSRHSHDDPNVSSGDEQPDAPRVAQWVDEDDLDEEEELSPDETEDDEETILKRDLSTLPLGALVKAQKAVRAAPQDSGSDDSDSDQESEPHNARKQPGEDDRAVRKGRRQIEHRSNKHAPMAVTSKKPVPRRRQVVEVHDLRPRDPRFSDLSGTLSMDHFRSHYDFLPELHTSELQTLRQTLSHARKLLRTSPQHLREEREEEVRRLELALKRAESTVNREKRENAEQHALGKLQQEEKEKRKAGKKEWWLKDADKKAIRVRARMDAIAASGGKRAVKKAIEKRQKKIGQKEKKSRPFAPGTQKRSRDEEGAREKHPKRRRVE